MRFKAAWVSGRNSKDTRGCQGLLGRFLGKRAHAYGDIERMSKSYHQARCLELMEVTVVPEGVNQGHLGAQQLDRVKL